MRRIILVIVLLALFIPVTGYAFSFSDLLWWRNKDVVEEEVVELSVQQKLTAQEKLVAWSKAYSDKNLSLVTYDFRYLNISKEELNFILEEQLGKYSEPPIQDVAVELSDGKVILEGYALKPFRGRAYMEVRIEVMEERLYFHVTKARYKGLFIPGSLVGRLIYSYLEPVSGFFFADDKYKLQDIEISGGNISFVIN